MASKTRQAGKRRRKASWVKLILALTIGVMIFIGYRQISADTRGLSIDDQGNEQNSISKTGYYPVILMDSADLALGDLVLVNKDHPYIFPDKLALISIYDHKKDCNFVRDKNVLLEKNVMERLNDLMKGFAEETGVCDVNVVAGYRTYDAQQKLYNNTLETKGHEHTDQYVALPGCSEHHTGLAVDFSIFHSTSGDSAEFDGTGDYGWLADNSWKFGFVQRFSESKTSVTDVADEPWHFRYVGLGHAYYMQQNNLCLEEYIDLLRQYPYDGAHLIIDTGEQKYEVYFSTGFEVQIPKREVYTVSGNNADGFIVTVSLGG